MLQKLFPQNFKLLVQPQGELQIVKVENYMYHVCNQVTLLCHQYCHLGTHKINFHLYICTSL